MVSHRWRGSALIMTMIVLMVLFTVGAALLSLTTTGLYRSQFDEVRSQSFDLAEAGVEKAIYYLRGTAPANSGSNVGTTDGTTNAYTDGSWRTAGWTETLSGVGSYTFSVADGTGDDSGKIIIISTGTATLGSRSRSRRLRVTMSYNRENVCVWNNVLFGGVGQAGQSIAGNVVMRGGVHLLGEGEKYTDTNSNGRYDSSANGGTYALGDWYIDTNGVGSLTGDYTGSGRLPYAAGNQFCEPFVDLNGNGTWDPPLTTTDLAEDVYGTADIGNNYNGMPAAMAALIPACPTDSSGLASLSAKLRVKHGQVSVNGSATVGASSNSGSPLGKGKMNGCYVNDGYTGNKGASSVYSDNGTTHTYDLGDIVQFPDLVSSVTENGTTYSNYLSYLQTGYSPAPMIVTGPLTLTAGTAYSKSDSNGNSIAVDSSGNMTISGIVYVNGDVNLNSGGSSTFTYSGRGTLVSTGNISIQTNLLSHGTFPTTDVMGLVARNNLTLPPAGSHALLLGAFYAQNQINSPGQNIIGGTFVSSYFSMNQVPHMYQVPSLATNLPPGMPGSAPIWVVTVTVDSWHEIAPS